MAVQPEVLDARMLSFRERYQVLKLAHAVQDAAKVLSDAVFRGIVSQIDEASAAVDAACAAFQEEMDKRLGRWAPPPEEQSGPIKAEELPAIITLTRRFDAGELCGLPVLHENTADNG